MKIISAYTVVIKSITWVVNDNYRIEYAIEGTPLKRYFAVAKEKDLYDEDTIREVIAKDIKRRKAEAEDVQRCSHLCFVGKRINVVA